MLHNKLWKLFTASGLRCWRCSSDATNSKFCGDTLDLSQITEQQKRWNYVECDVKPPQNAEKIENLIPKCRILLQLGELNRFSFNILTYSWNLQLFWLVNDVQTYTRSCYWEQENVPSNSCAIQKYNPSYVKTVACNTCVEDGCNDKLISTSVEVADNSKNMSADNPSNAAVLALLSHTVFAIFVLSMIIGY